MLPSPKKNSPRLIGEILNIVQNAIFLVDSNDQIFFANSRMAKMFRGEVEDLRGLALSQIFMPDDHAILLPNIKKITKEEGEFETEVMLCRLDGSSFLGLLSSAFFVWEGEGGMAITIHDISKMKALERTLRRVDHVAFLGNMLDDINHQIRNPVLVIGGLARRLQEKDRTNKYLQVMVQESGRLENLLDTLNAFISLPRPELCQVGLAELAAALVNRFKPYVENQGLRWRYDSTDPIRSGTVLVDLDLLLEAFDAVVRNACEAYDGGKGSDEREVVLQLFATGEPEYPYAARITDQGCGIHEEDLPFVASHFFTKKTKHIGMGLTFAQRIVEEQGGRLVVASSERDGTSVTFLLIRERRRVIRTMKM